MPQGIATEGTVPTFGPQNNADQMSCWKIKGHSFLVSKTLFVSNTGTWPKISTSIGALALFVQTSPTCSDSHFLITAEEAGMIHFKHALLGANSYSHLCHMC